MTKAPELLPRVRRLEDFEVSAKHDGLEGRNMTGNVETRLRAVERRLSELSPGDEDNHGWFVMYDEAGTIVHESRTRTAGRVLFALPWDGRNGELLNRRDRHLGTLDELCCALGITTENATR
jgi:hypothetical protein